jgi:hypothetical protein
MQAAPATALVLQSEVKATTSSEKPPSGPDVLDKENVGIHHINLRTNAAHSSDAN